MSDAETKTTPEDMTEKTMPPSPERDWLLQGFVRMANETNLEMGLTLVVGGATWSGQLISYKTFFKELGEVMGKAVSSGQLAEAIESYAFPEKHGGQPFDPTMPPTYIHLRGARVFHPNVKPMPDAGALWRGRISEVQGFIVGSLNLTG